jgi:hypothetical protein
VSATQSIDMCCEKCIATGGGHLEQLLWSRYFSTGKYCIKTHSQL